MNIYVVADTHLFHNNIKKYCNRPDNFNELIIDNWNKTIKDEDLVIHLGDVIFDKDRIGIIKTLKGQKILVKGSHDTETNTFYINNGFILVCKFICISNILLSHEPIPHWFLSSNISCNVHGHFHNNDTSCWEKELKAQIGDKHLLFILEKEGTNYMPVLLEEVHKKLIKTKDVVNGLIKIR